MRAILVLSLIVASVYSQTNVLNEAACGTRPLIGRREIDEDSGKIVGGVVSTAGDWKWMVIMRSNGRFICGSSLINSIWLLTAAHCTSGQ